MEDFSKDELFSLTLHGVCDFVIAAVVLFMVACVVGLAFAQ